MEEPEVPIEKVQEHIEHQSAHSTEKWISMVALSTAILAAFAAVSALLAGDHANDAMISQIEASDQWGYYQAKGIKAEVVKDRLELQKLMGHPTGDSDTLQLARYSEEQVQIKENAENKQKLAEVHLRKHVILARAVTMFQIAIAVGAISVLTKQRLFWAVSLLFGAAGIAFLIHGILVG